MRRHGRSTRGRCVDTAPGLHIVGSGGRIVQPSYGRTSAPALLYATTGKPLSMPPSPRPSGAGMVPRWHLSVLEDVDMTIHRGLGHGPTLPTLVDLKEVAEYLGVTPRTVHRWIAT